MAFKVSHGSRRLAGSTYMATLRKTEINPGDKKLPTPYRSMSYFSSESPGSITATNFVYGTVTKTDTTLGIGSTPMSGGEYWAKLYDDVPYDVPSYKDAYAKAVSRLITDVLDQRYSEFNAAVFMAESGEALASIRNAAFRIAMAMKSIRKGRLRDAYRYLGKSADFKHRAKVPRAATVRDNAASYWLELQYAWKPLLSDAKNGAEKLADIMLDKPPLFSARGRGTTSATTVATGKTPVNWSSIRTETVRVEVKVYYSIPSKALLLAASLGLTDPLTVAWELFPFSFVIDWFLPIGSFLEELSAFNGLSFSSGYTSALKQVSYSIASGDRKVTEEMGWVGSPSYWGVQRRVVQTYGGYSVRTVAFERSRMYSFPRPNPPRPRFGLKGLERTLSALSLLHVIRRS